ncbi:hypothetical protein DFA_08498 [Cavenderia fasciculata]|uniref:Uncharacterized protein n=1 Tax=Cavenderia fasciculata TaxID=261658 RepID=F4Q2N5_CACFS|nr:uncharacterized protein DFA_08498 [Cavenderia fasciculata]EGG17502.1 hypothetical protein DFA_08498 [Cavenderia fasciculata]|eukprot:XP_004355986.1 hypothetical protein DFA_08498 [Cavenderia fasciculata]
MSQTYHHSPNIKSEDDHHHHHRHHYDSNTITREKIETLFLLRMFDNVIIQCLTLLNGNQYMDMESNNNNNGSGNNTTTKKINSLLEMTDGLQHSCAESSSSSSLLDTCQCQWIIELLVQSLYEVGRSDDAISLVYGFYFNSLLPFNVLILITHLLVDNKQYKQSKYIIEEALNRRKVVGSDYYDPNDVDVLTQDGYDQLVELLIFHVMFRMNETEEAKNYLLLGNASHLSPHKLQGFTQSLQEMIQIKEIEEKNQKELQLLQEKEKEKEKLRQQQLPKSSSSSPSISNSPSFSNLNSVNNNINNNNNEDQNNNNNIDNSQRKMTNRELLNRFIQGGTKEKMEMMITLFKNSIVKTKRAIGETGSLIVPDRKRVRKMLPLLIWSTIIFFSIRHLVKVLKARNKPLPLPNGSKIKPTHNNNNASSLVKRRNLGSSSSNRFNQNNNSQFGSPFGNIYRSFKELISLIVNYRY